ncbi:MAG: carbonate dehydratase [Anaerolineae bacterium]
MSDLKHLLSQNRAWAERMTAENPDFFKRLEHAQHPHYLWLGCSDSRVSPDQIIGEPTGEIFVHRNVANLVVHSDFNFLSVLQYGVEVLKIQDIIVCGHYGCGGIHTAMQHDEYGLIDQWLLYVRDIYRSHQDDLKRLPDEQARFNRLCELNVIHQVHNICHTTIVQNAWKRGQSVAVHAWIYNLHDGRIRDLNFTITEANQLDNIYQMVQRHAQT